MNIELITHRGSYDVIASIELPTLPVPGQEICLVAGGTYKVSEAIWHQADHYELAASGTVVVTKTRGN